MVDFVVNNADASSHHRHLVMHTATPLFPIPNMASAAAHKEQTEGAGRGANDAHNSKTPWHVRIPATCQPPDLYVKSNTGLWLVTVAAKCSLMIVATHTHTRTHARTHTHTHLVGANTTAIPIGAGSGGRGRVHDRHDPTPPLALAAHEAPFLAWGVWPEVGLHAQSITAT
jgi:hypothetical protein